MATSAHFLLQPRPLLDNGILIGETDITTLDAHDWDVSVQTGFMPPVQPLLRLPAPWNTWETILGSAIANKLPLGDDHNASSEARLVAERWRVEIANLPMIETHPLANSETRLRRAHLVLAFLLHFYIHSIPSDRIPTPLIIPKALAIPLLTVSAHLQLPPVLTYSDTVLYNWATINPQLPVSESNIRIVTTLTNTPDEAHFYLTSAKIELRGVKALDLMRSSMNEAFVGDATAIHRITLYLNELANAVSELTEILATVRTDCRPLIFYNVIRPWLRGFDALSMQTQGTSWTFEGADELDLSQPTELSGPSAGQSSLIHAMDIFMGTDSDEGSPQQHQRRNSFLERMKMYMPRHHRSFLAHLGRGQRTRDLVLESKDNFLKQAFNKAAFKLKLFRDEHIRIVALYIVTQRGPAATGATSKGTGGTDAMPFLKQVRDQTAQYLI